MMTNERAKEELQKLIAVYWIGLEPEHIEALEKAIKALEIMEHYEDDMKDAFDRGYDCAERWLYYRKELQKQ